MRSSLKRAGALCTVLVLGTALAACGSSSKKSSSAGSTTSTSSGTPSISASSFTSDVSAMAQLKGLASEGKGLVGVLLPDTTTSARYVTFDAPYMTKAFQTAGLTHFREARRRARGLVAPPVSLTLIKIGSALVAGIVVVVICNTNRGTLVPIRGVPWVVLIVLGVLALWTFVLGRTRFGRYMYAIGGSAEAARRAGVGLARIRTVAFVLASFTAGIAGIVGASRLRSVSTAFDGGQLVLYPVAAAVIGGTSLFGGRGKAVHAVLGGLVIAAIDNGMAFRATAPT